MNKGEVQKTASDVVKIEDLGSKKAPDKRKIWIMAAIGLIVCLLFIFSYFPISGPDLSCDNKKVKDILGQIVKKGLKQEAGAYGQIVGGDAGDIQNIIDRVDISISQITTKAENSKGCLCQAVVNMAAPQKRGSTFVINYTTSLTKEKNIYVELEANTLMGKLIYGGNN